MTDGAPIPHGAPWAELPAVIPAKPLFTGRRLAAWPVLFTVVLVSAHYAARFVRRFVWFDCPPHWPLSIFNPRGPHHVVEWAALAATVGGGAWVIHFLRRRGFPLPYVGGFGLLLILLSNAIQGVPKGFFNPIAGGRAPEQYYHDALHVSSVATLLRNFAILQPLLHTHARTHPPGAVLLFYGLHTCLGLLPWQIAVVFAGAATLLSAWAFPRLVRNVLPSDRAFSGYGTLLFLLLPAVQIYYCATLDAVIAALLLCSLAVWSDSPTRRNTLLASAFVAAASFLTFGVVWVVPALITLDAARGRYTRWLALLVALAVFYVVLKGLTGFDYLAAARLASHLENPRGFRLLVEPISYAFTRIEDVSEILVFFGPFLTALLWRGLRRNPSTENTRDARALFAGGTTSLLLLFLSGAFHTGETARACLFLYPILLLPVLSTMRTAEERDRTLLLLLVLAQTVLMQACGNYFW